MHEPDPTGARQDLTVGEAARLVGVSVRTLHHWDALGLAVPSGRTWSGYRLYSPDDVARAAPRVLTHRLVPAGRQASDASASKAAARALARHIKSIPVPGS